ncbi:MAG: NERD domain-containing protein [Alphaproteobacteria bacterium]|nr:NERD domain-containing protein [Alphaproteobacteria bacterium]
MARMIPARIDDGGVSAGERRVFSLLANDPDSKEWTALHSLGLARRTTGPYGEIDFVVIIPGEGILCLEVKGGRVSCDEGQWRTINRHGNVALLSKSPFHQVRESMFALRKAITRRFGESAPETRSPIGCGVVFPDVICPPVTPEFERQDVIDFDDLRGPISRPLMRLAHRRLREFQPRGGDRLPTAAQARSIANFLRPDFELIVAKGVSIGHTEARLLRLTEEQYSRLDELEANPRCLFEGAAGTGKTLLAIEYARRASSDGARVCLVCFNRLLGEWLQGQTKSGEIMAGTWHGIARRLILESSAAEEFMDKERHALNSGDVKTFFGELYPFYAAIALEERGAPFDALVVDEAQDLCSAPILDVLNLAIPGGLAGGRWAVFGDFTRQALYGSRDDPLAVLSRYSEHFVRAKLTLNCRNTRRIAEETALIAGFEKLPYRLSDETGLPVEHRYWKTRADLGGLLTDAVSRLVKERTPIDDIVILSPRRLENSSLAGVKTISSVPLVDISRGTTGVQSAIRFSTVHSFKGLESPVVIVVDIDEVDTDEPQSLLYVAMSRARSLLVLMISEAARKSVEHRIRAAMVRELHR